MKSPERASVISMRSSPERPCPRDAPWRAPVATQHRPAPRRRTGRARAAQNVLGQSALLGGAGHAPCLLETHDSVLGGGVTLLGGLLEGGQVQMEPGARRRPRRRPPRRTGKFSECPRRRRGVRDVLIFSNMAVTSQMLGAFGAPIVFCRHLSYISTIARSIFRISREKIYRPPRHPRPFTAHHRCRRALPAIAALQLSSRALPFQDIVALGVGRARKGPIRRDRVGALCSGQHGLSE